MPETTDVILLSHSVHADIDEDEMRRAVPEDWTVRAAVDVRPERLTLESSRSADWMSLAREQERLWREKVKPLLDRYPRARIAYFGLAPIPLAVHLGSLTERWPAVSVFLRHHESRSWKYTKGSEPTVSGPDGPKELVRSNDPALVCVSTTAPADVEAARRAAGATSAEIDIRTEPLHEDVLSSSETAVSAVAERFREALALIEKNRPGVSEVHLAAAIPVGLAFLLGTCITPTRQAKVVTYQYHRSAEVRLTEALRLPLRLDSRGSFTEKENAFGGLVHRGWEDQRTTGQHSAGDEGRGRRMNPAHRLAPAVDFARQVLARGHEGTETHRLATYVVQLSEELDECVRTLRDVEAIDEVGEGF